MAGVQLGAVLGKAISDGEDVEKNIITNYIMGKGQKVSSDADAEFLVQTHPDSKRETDFHPYIKVKLNRAGGLMEKTKWALHANGQPEWNEILTFEINPENRKNTPEKQNSSVVSNKETTADVRLKFEVWHRDLGVSLDDHVGSGTLVMQNKQFTSDERWTAKERIRLQNERGTSPQQLCGLSCFLHFFIFFGQPLLYTYRILLFFPVTSTGIATGLIYVTIKWRKNDPRTIEALQSSQTTQDTNANANETYIFPNGTLTVIVEKGDHVTDPNKVGTLVITRSTQILLVSSGLVFSYFALGAVVFLSFEGPNSGIDSVVLHPSVSNATGRIMFTGVIDSLYFTVCTFTTVGYGDIVPQLDGLKIFTVFYSLCGVVIIAVGVNVMVNACIASTKELVTIIGADCCNCHFLIKPVIQRPVTLSIVYRRIMDLIMKLTCVILVGTIAYMCPGMVEGKNMSCIWSSL